MCDSPLVLAASFSSWHSPVSDEAAEYSAANGRYNDAVERCMYRTGPEMDRYHAAADEALAERDRLWAVLEAKVIALKL